MGCGNSSNEVYKPVSEEKPEEESSAPVDIFDSSQTIYSLADIPSKMSPNGFMRELERRKMHSKYPPKPPRTPLMRAIEYWRLKGVKMKITHVETQKFRAPSGSTHDQSPNISISRQPSMSRQVYDHDTPCLRKSSNVSKSAGLNALIEIDENNDDNAVQNNTTAAEPSAPALQNGKNLRHNLDSEQKRNVTNRAETTASTNDQNSNAELLDDNGLDVLVAAVANQSNEGN